MFITSAQPTPGAGSLPPARLDAMAVDFIKQNATEDHDFGTVDGGNLGLSAYSLSPTRGRALLDAAREIYPGARELKSFQFNPTAQNLVAVVKSEDEPRIFVCSQSKATGKCSQPIIDINVVDLTGVSPEKLQAVAPGADNEDGFSAMSPMFSNERYLDLGEGSGRRLWWE